MILTMRRAAITRWPILAWALGAALWAWLACAAEPGGARMNCVSNGKHLWLIASNPPPRPGFMVLHHAADLEGPYYKSQADLSSAPEVIASWENRLWLGFPAKGGQGVARDVFTMQVQKEPTLGMYLPVPSGRLDIASPLPGLGQLVAFEGALEGPVALLVPFDRAGVIGGPHSIAAEPNLEHPRLLQLRQDAWVDLGLPEDFAASNQIVLAVSSAGDEITLIAPGSIPGECLRFDRDQAGNWNCSKIDLDIRRLRSAVSIRRQIAVVLADGAAGQASIAYLRGGSLAPLTQFPLPSGAWDVIGLDDRLQLATLWSDGRPALQDIDPLTGVVGIERSMEVQPLAAGRLWQVTLLLAFSVSGMLLVFVIRPGARSVSVPFPKGKSAAPLSMRFCALAIDMIPAGVATMALLNCSLTQLLTTPMFTIDLEESVPYLLMIGLTMAHSAVSELTWKTTFGKRVMGIEILSADGDPIGRRRLLVRNIVKMVVLLLPPLAVFVAVNPNMQGLPELASRSVLVRSTPPEEAGSSEE